MNNGIFGLPAKFGVMPQGLLGRPSPIPTPHRFWHPEAIDWSIRCTANGGVVSDVVMRAVHRFCSDIDAAGIRSQIRRLNLFVGGNLAGALVPLYLSTVLGGATFGNSIDTNTNFVSADFTEIGSGAGLKGNGTNKYLDTGFTPASMLSLSSIHLSCSATNLETSVTTPPGTCALGTFDGTTATLYDITIAVVAGSNYRSFRAGSNVPNTPFISSVGRAEESHLVGVRSSPSASALYAAGALAASSAIPTTQASSTRSMFVFAINNSGAPVFHTAARMRAYSIGSALSATQVASFSDAVATFNAALGR